MASLPTQFDHPAWLTAASTVGGYLLILALMSVLLFGVPFVVFGGP